jgi:hypothetical protein
VVASVVFVTVAVVLALVVVLSCVVDVVVVDVAVGKESDATRLDFLAPFSAGLDAWFISASTALFVRFGQA